MSSSIIQEEDLTAELFDKFYQNIRFTPGCWEWVGVKEKRYGYGKLAYGYKPSRLVTAHRLAWAFANWIIPPSSTFICHHCDNPSCVRADHLFAGTPGDNMRDMARKGRSSRQKITHCPHGHPYTDTNTVRYKDGKRRCKICIGLHCQRLAARRKANSCPT